MDAYNEYLEVLKTKSPKTFLIYTHYLEIFLKEFKILSPKDIEKIETSQLLHFRDNIISGGSSTKNLAIRIILAYINFLYDNKKIHSKENIEQLKKLKEPKTVKRFLTDEEKARLIATAKYKDVRAMMALLAYEGLRRDEAINLKKSDYKDEHIIVTGKGNRQRRMKLHPLVKKLLDEYIQSRKDDCEYLFVAHRSKDEKVHGITGESVRIQVKTSCQRAGIDPKDVHPHTLRHTFASSLLSDGVSTINVRDLLGHSSVSTTELYAHTQQKNLDDIVTSQK